MSSEESGLLLFLPCSQFPQFKSAPVALEEFQSHTIQSNMLLTFTCNPNVATLTTPTKTASLSLSWKLDLMTEKEKLSRRYYVIPRCSSADRSATTTGSENFDFIRDRQAAKFRHCSVLKIENKNQSSHVLYVYKCWPNTDVIGLHIRAASRSKEVSWGPGLRVLYHTSGAGENAC